MHQNITEVNYYFTFRISSLLLGIDVCFFIIDIVINYYFTFRSLNNAIRDKRVLYEFSPERISNIPCDITTEADSPNRHVSHVSTYAITVETCFFHAHRIVMYLRSENAYQFPGG